MQILAENKNRRFIRFLDSNKSSNKLIRIIMWSNAIMGMRMRMMMVIYLYIIGAVCLYVTKRHHFPYSKDFVISPVYSFIPNSKELVVSMFIDTFRIQKCLETVKRQSLVARRAGTLLFMESV